MATFATKNATGGTRPQSLGNLAYADAYVAAIVGEFLPNTTVVDGWKTRFGFGRDQGSFEVDGIELGKHVRPPLVSFL